jgi:hypothetical protein
VGGEGREGGRVIERSTVQLSLDLAVNLRRNSTNEPWRLSHSTCSIGAVPAAVFGLLRSYPRAVHIRKSYRVNCHGSVRSQHRTIFGSTDKFGRYLAVKTPSIDPLLGPSSIQARKCGAHSAQSCALLRTAIARKPIALSHRTTRARILRNPQECLRLPICPSHERRKQQKDNPN